MTELEKMAETFNAAFGACPSALAEDGDRAGLLAVLEKHIQPLLAEAFLDGFKQSGEGYNCEYPFDDGKSLARMRESIGTDKYAANIIKRIIGE